jgi:O-antigen/teichoic acid export membrane protein
MDGRFSLAITLPKEDSDSKIIVYLCNSVTLVLSVLLGVSVIILYFLNQVFEISWFPDWALFLPLIALIVGFTESFRFYLTRFSKFNDLAKSRIVQAVVLVISHLIFGFLKLGYWGLILGQFCGYLVYVVYLYISIKKFENLNISQWRSTFTEQKYFAKKYKDFPLFSMPSDGISVLTSQAPVFFLKSFFGSVTTGIYSLTNRVQGIPGSTIAKSILEVYKDKASREYREKGNCRSAFLKTFYLLLGITIVPFLVIMLFGEPLFAFVFGEDWRLSGTYAMILAPLFAFKMVVSPLSYTLIIAERQRLDFYLHLLMVIAIPASLFVSYKLFENAATSLAYFVATYCVIYLIYLITSYKLSLGNGRKLESAD